MKNDKQYQKEYGIKNRKHLSAYHKNWRKKNRDKTRQNKLKSRYGITLEDYKIMYRVQKGKCAICGIKKKIFNTDHNHKTKKVRGLLCWSCNVGLGKFKDSIVNLKRAINYLKGDK